METKRYQKGEVIFHELTIGSTMYEIKSGSVGIYTGYGKPEERKLTELGAGRIFGEMSVIEVYPRSATAVASEDVEAVEISTSDLQAYFKSNPDKLVEIMRSLSRRVRELTKDYNEACDALDEWRGATKKGSSKRTGLLGLLDRFAAAYNESLRYADYSSGMMMYH